MSQDEISQMLANHGADSIEEVRGGLSFTKKDKVISEIGAIYDENPWLEDELPRMNLHVDIADFKRAHGKCLYNHTNPNERRVGHYCIRIARAVIGEDEHDWRNTVRHEVAHALHAERTGGDANHGPEWKQAARDVGATPERCAHTRHTDGDYVLRCPNDCYSREYHRRSKRIKQPWRYKCGECGENVVSHDAGERVSLEPGTCGVESISWDTQREYRARR